MREMQLQSVLDTPSDGSTTVRRLFFFKILQTNDSLKTINRDVKVCPEWVSDQEGVVEKGGGVFS